jgi:GTP cyclohydrolase I|nr:MAG TPA: GTP cyclohydrolase I [Caudoviricetes sp.]
MINKELIEKSIRNILIALGDDPEREGLKETPKRVAKMYEEVFEGMNYTNEEIAEKFSKCFNTDNNDLVVVQDIPIFSYCEHHLALMYNMKVSIAYIPNGKVLGLSKFARIAEMVGKRLQLQEKIGNDIAEVIQLATGSKDVLVVVEGEHSCMTARGIKSRGSKTRTSTIRGNFRDNIELRKEAYSLMNL